MYPKRWKILWKKKYNRINTKVERGYLILKYHKEKTAVLIISFLLLSGSILFLFYIPPKILGDSPFSTNTKANDIDLGDQTSPALAVDFQGRAYVVWEDYRNGDWDIYFAKSTDFGATWSSPNAKVSTDGSNSTQSAPQIAIGPDGTLYTVWQDDRNGDYDIYFAKSTNGGTNWTDPNIKVDNGTLGQTTPTIAVSSAGTIFVAWEDYRWGNYDIYFSKSTDGGFTWSDDNKRINRDSTTTKQLRPTMAVDSTGVIYVAWQDQITGDNDIHIGKSSDGGETWLDPSIRVNTDLGTQGQGIPSIAIYDSDCIYLVWEDNRLGNPDVYFAKSLDGGVNWTDPNIKVNSDSGTTWQLNPKITVSWTGTIYATWQDLRSVNSDIYFAYSINGGVNWTFPNLRVNDDTQGRNQRYPAIGIGNNGPIYVAWEDYRSGISDDIYSAKIDPINPFPVAEQLKVEGYFGGTQGIRHIIPSEPTFSFRYTDPSSDTLTQYNASVWDELGSTLLWWCNRTQSVSSGSQISLIYNTAPYPTFGPQLIDGISYKLRVQVENTSGVWSPASQVNFHLNEVLMPTEPVIPPDNSIISSSHNQTISWSPPGMDSEGDFPVSYNWEVARDSEFKYIIENGSGLVTESNPFDTRPSGYFYWRVNITDGWETGTYGNQPDGFWNFTTYTGLVPNNPPVITNKGEEPNTSYVKIPATFTFTAFDPESDPLTWNVISGPLWLNLGSANGTIFGAPSPDDWGFNHFSINVSDGKGGMDNHTFTIFVELTPTTNNPPTITNKDSAPTQASVNTILDFTFTATDPDSDPLSWSKLTGPDWLSIGTTNGTIFGTPFSEDMGPNEFSIRVADGKGGTDNCTFTVTVDDGLDDDTAPDDDSSPLCWILLILIVIILLILFILIMRKTKEEEDEKQKQTDISREQESKGGEPEEQLGEEGSLYKDEEPPPPDYDDLPSPEDEEEPPPPEDDDLPFPKDELTSPKDEEFPDSDEEEPPPPDDEDLD